MARRMVGMRFGIDEEPHRHWGELLDGVEDGPRIGRRMSAVDQHDPVLGENDAGIGIEVLANIDVNAVGKLPNLRPEILRKCGRACYKSDERDQCCCGLDPHD